MAGRGRVGITWSPFGGGDHLGRVKGALAGRVGGPEKYHNMFIDNMLMICRGTDIFLLVVLVGEPPSCGGRFTAPRLLG